MKHTLITVSGQLGSGKSTVVNLLAQKLGWATYSTGQAQRQIAEKMGISTLELNRLAVSDKTIDEQIDAVFKNPPWGDRPCVVDSRLAFHFLPESFKVCLKVSPDEAAKRVFNANRSNEKLGEKNINIVDIRAPQNVKSGRSLSVITTNVEVPEMLVNKIREAVNATKAFSFSFEG